MVDIKGGKIDQSQKRLTTRVYRCHVSEFRSHFWSCLSGNISICVRYFVFCVEFIHNDLSLAVSKKTCFLFGLSIIEDKIFTYLNICLVCLSWWASVYWRLLHMAFNSMRAASRCWNAFSICAIFAYDFV